MTELHDDRRIIPQVTGFAPSFVHGQPNPTSYVLGFAFYRGQGTYSSVVLIEKKRPTWQAGKLNGVGGKIEFGETSATAMAREFQEETGVLVRAAHWHRFYTMSFANGAVIDCFTCMLPTSDVQTKTDEFVLVLPITQHGSVATTKPMINNLRWLVPMAWHQLNEPEVERVRP